MTPDWRSGSSRCPGSGTRLVPGTYVVRKVEESDRPKWEGWDQVEEERGDFEATQGHRDSLGQWEQEQGQEKEELVCPIFQRRWLSPIARGTSRPHRLSDIPQPSWDRVLQLRRDIQTLPVELDRKLDLLEEAGAFG
jgi:hypothetical protein